ncbi:GCD complex subunit gcd7 [Malassezia brasiliensis]|uniref:Translation initiation factor eIF2B subunit beta n=1 Tax=Malassezia brasiliensis TaxID=1821822 RepID=A0AAF0DTK0_9BASI|nr:GCD complex subunit gcd7 [Malassezia brasiliensis]
MPPPRAPARRRPAPRVPGAPWGSHEELVEACAPHTLEDVPRGVHDLLRACDAAFFDQHMQDAQAHTRLAQLFLRAGVLCELPRAALDADATPDAVTAALLDALRPALRTGTSAYVLLLLYELVLCAAERNPNVFRWLLYTPMHEVLLPGLVRRLVHNVWAGHYAGQSRTMLGSGSVAPALPLPGAMPRRTQPCMIEGHLSNEGLQVWLQYKALALLYELLCTVRLRQAELVCIGEPFVCHLFDEAEATRTLEDETLGVLVTQLLLALHEQYMAAVQGMSPAPFSILAVIRDRAHATRTFAENVVFMLNRTPCTDTAGCRFHLLVLKLLDALFAMPETASYFYMNDLKVLVDIFLRQITDLAEQRELLRQVYLRVLPALLTQTQLCTVAYKREAIRDVLGTIVRYGDWSNTAPRTVELARRCLAAEWVVDARMPPVVAPIGGGVAHPEVLVTEHTHQGDVFHAETSEAALHTLLKLGQMQSAAAAAVEGDAMPSWPPAPPEPALPVAELDVLALETLASGRASPRSSVSSAPPARRRAPPPPPLLAPRTDERRAHVSSMPPSPYDASVPVEHAAPPMRHAPANHSAPSLAVPTPAPSIPAATSTARVDDASVDARADARGRHRLRALFRRAPAPRGAEAPTAPPPRRRAAPRPPAMEYGALEDVVRDRASQLAVKEFASKLRRQQIQGTQAVAEATAKTIRGVVSSAKYWRLEELVRMIRTVGHALQDALPSEPVIGNVTRRVLFLLREEAKAAQNLGDLAGAPAGGARAQPHPSVAQSLAALSLSPSVPSSPSTSMHDARPDVMRRSFSIADLVLTGASGSVTPLAEAAAPLAQSVDDVSASPLRHGTHADELSESDSDSDEAPAAAAPSHAYQLKPLLIQAIQELIDEIETVDTNISKDARDHIHSGEVILTVGNSATVRNFLRSAAKHRKFITVVPESAPSFSGHEMARALSAAGLSVLLVPDSNLYALMPRVSKVLLGARCVLANGGILSAVGAKLVAMAAREHATPVVALAGVYRVSPDWTWVGPERLARGNQGAVSEVVNYATSARLADEAEIANPLWT